MTRLTDRAPAGEVAAPQLAPCRIRQFGMLPQSLGVEPDGLLAPILGQGVWIAPPARTGYDHGVGGLPPAPRAAELDSGRHGSDYRRVKSALGRDQRSVYSLRPHVFFKPFRLDPGALMDVNLPQGSITRIDESVRHARRDDDDLSGVGVEVGRPDRKGR